MHDAPAVRPLGVVAFSFGLRPPEEEPNPANVALASITRRLVEGAGRPAVVVAQWEIAIQLDRDGLAVDHRVVPQPDHYLDSVEVWRQAAAVLRPRGVRDVALVAHPFLHHHYVARLARADAFDVVPTPRGRVPFDRSGANQQWWTRSRVHLGLYALGQQAPSTRRWIKPWVGAWPH